MNNLYKFLIIVFITNYHESLAQNDVPTGTVEIIQDAQIKELLTKHVAVNARGQVKGYRVKIHFGADKSRANSIREEFRKNYENVSAYVKYDQPYFNVSVGNYRTKLEAYKFLKEVQIEYTSAFLVQENIVLAELGSEEKIQK